MSWLSSLIRKQPQGPLTRKGLLQSELWVDQPDAGRRIDERLAAGSLDEDTARRLHQFVDEGYTTLPLGLDDGVYDELVSWFDRAWSEKPDHLAYAYHSGLKSFALADEAAERKPSYRIADLHAYSEGARALFLNQRIFHLIEETFGQPAVATQSLSFEFGSQQALHRDPIHVHMSPPSHLAAAWIALEDISPDCGPLTYIPGSHRLPYYRTKDGEYRLHQGHHGEAEVRAAEEFDARECAKAGLEVQAFTPKKGEALIWHHSLLHGGSTPNDPSLTRRSFVVHFTTQGNYPRLRQTVLMPGEDGAPPRPRTFGTDRLLEAEGARGFDNPLRPAESG